MHTPPLQDSPVPQAWSQVPQLFESVFRSKQPLPHWVIAPPSPPVQLSAQVPFKHTRPVPQVEPHVPQLSPLVERSTHLPSHDVFPPEHVGPVIESPPAPSFGIFASEEVPSVWPPSADVVVLLLLHPLPSDREATAKTYAASV